MNIITFLYAFLFSGVICVFAQILYEYTKMTPGHITSLFVLFGVLLESFNIYDSMVDIFGGGALTPILNYGHTLAHAAIEGAKEEGFLGILKGLFSTSSAVMVTVVVLGAVSSLIAKPRCE